MKSFKLESQVPIKRQLEQGGIFIIAIGLILFFVWSTAIGILAMAFGALLLLASKASD